MKIMGASCLGFTLAAATSTVWSNDLPAWAERLGWCLVHSTWQLAVIGIAAAVVLNAMQRRSAQARYLVGVAALLLMVVVPCGTWTLISEQPIETEQSIGGSADVRLVTGSSESSLPGPATRGDGVFGSDASMAGLSVLGRASSVSGADVLAKHASSEVRTGTGAMNSLQALNAGHLADASTARRGWKRLLPSTVVAAIEKTQRAIAPRLSTVVLWWLVGVLVCAIRPLHGLWMQHRLQSVGLIPVSVELQDLLRRLADRMGIRRPLRISESILVTVPMVVGYLRPIVLLPSSALLSLTPSELEAIVIHELAHVRRHDWVINALQVLVETLLFYHPAVWWLSRRVQQEREFCCDDFAVRIIGDKATYGRALLALEELRQSVPSPVLAATGGDLVERIRRLVPNAAVRRRRTSVRGMVAGLVLLVGIVLSSLVVVAANQVQESVPESVPQQSEKREPAKPAAQPQSPVEAEKQRSAELEIPLVPKSAMIEFRHLLSDDLHSSLDQVIDDEPVGDVEILRGQILSGDGKPVSGAKVVLSQGRRYLGQLFRSNLAVSNDSGRFVVRGGPELRVLNIEVGNVGWVTSRPVGQADIVLKMPTLRAIQLRFDRSIPLADRKLHLECMSIESGSILPTRRLVATLDDMNIARFDVPAGRYLVSGSRPLNGADKESQWSWSVLGEVTVSSEGPLDVVAQPVEGSRISGHVANFKQLLETHKASDAYVSVMVPIQKHGQWEELQFDSALCDANGDFKLGPLPMGRAFVRVDFRSSGNQAGQILREKSSITKRVLLAKRLEVVELPSTRDGTLKDRIETILDSSAPINASWSHADVQVSMLRSLTPSSDVASELIRLMNDPQIPDNWQHVVIRTLGTLRPVTAEVKAALLAGAKNPALRRRPEMLNAIGSMKADAIDMLDEVAKFRDPENFYLRSSALRAMNDIETAPQKSPLVVGALIEALDDPVAYIRAQVAGDVGRYKIAAAREVILRRLKSDPSDSVRAVCAWAIYQIDDSVEDALPVLIALLKSSNLDACRDATSYLALFDHRASEAIPALEALTKFDGKPPFNRRIDSLQFQLRRSAEFAIKQITNAVTAEAKKQETNEMEERKAKAKPNASQADGLLDGGSKAATPDRAAGDAQKSDDQPAGGEAVERAKDAAKSNGDEVVVRIRSAVMSDESADKQKVIETLRGQGHAALVRGDYPAMEHAYLMLVTAELATAEDALSLGNSRHLQGRWKEAAQSYQLMLTLADQRIVALQQQTGPTKEQQQANELPFGGPVRDWKVERDRELERLSELWPQWVLLAGQIELHEVGDARAAAKTLARGLRFIPEAESMETLLDDATVGVAKKPGAPHRNWFKWMYPMATQRALGMAYEKLGDHEAAARCWCRFHLSHLAYVVGMTTTTPEHMEAVIGKVPAEKRQAFHEFVLKHPQRPKVVPRPFDIPEQLKSDPKNPFEVRSRLDGFQMLNLGPAQASVTRLKSGSWFMAFTSGDAYQARVMLARSVDGKSWEKPYEFALNNIFPTRCPSVIEDDDGTLWMLFSSQRCDPNRYSSGGYQWWLCSSKDGRDWSPLRSLYDGNGVFGGQYQHTAQITRDRQGKFWIFSMDRYASVNRLTDRVEMQPLNLGLDKDTHITSCSATFDAQNRCHLALTTLKNMSLTMSRDMQTWQPLQVVRQAPANQLLNHPRLLVDGDRLALLYDTGFGQVQSGRIQWAEPANGQQGAGSGTSKVALNKPINLNIALSGSLLTSDGDDVLLIANQGYSNSPPVVLSAKRNTVLSTEGSDERAQ